MVNFLISVANAKVILIKLVGADFAKKLGEEAQQYTGGNSRTDYACHVRTHSVHQQVV